MEGLIWVLVGTGLSEFPQTARYSLIANRHVNFGFKLKSKKWPQIETTFGVSSGPQGPNLGSIRVMLALRLRILSDFTVSSCFGHIQSIIIG